MLIKWAILKQIVVFIMNSMWVATTDPDGTFIIGSFGVTFVVVSELPLLVYPFLPMGDKSNVSWE